MSADVLKYYFALKLVRNQVSHASSGEDSREDNYVKKLYQEEYSDLKMGTFEDVKALLQKGIKISKTATEYVKQHAKIDK